MVLSIWRDTTLNQDAGIHKDPVITITIIIIEELIALLVVIEPFRISLR
jgi:hypothetical protein